MPTKTWLFCSSAVLGAIIICSVGSAFAEDVSRRVVAVQWPPVDPNAAPSIPDPRLAGRNDVLLPVLIPQRFLKFRTFAFVGEELHYAASVLADGAKLTISGNRVAIDRPRKSVSPRRSGPEAGEGSAQAVRLKYGVAYKVTVECARMNDRRCTTAAFAERLLSQAKFVGGSDAAPSQEAAAPPSPADPPFDPSFTFDPPGRLVSGSGVGVESPTVYAPGIRFPIEAGPAYLNSQVWGIGGKHGRPGSWKNMANYQYPWRDTFCEKRPERRTPSCPSGTGHQGADIRPATADDATHWAVAAEAGRVTDVGIYTVTLVGRSGSEYRYLHMAMDQLAVKQGDTVTRGQRLGLVSNSFGGSPTPVHLHFEILQNVDGLGYQHVPPYSSLVRAYKGGSS